MSARSWNYYLVKTARVSGWLLFLLVLLYIVTGFALCGEFGVQPDYRRAAGAVDSQDLRMAAGGDVRHALGGHHLLRVPEVGMDQNASSPVPIHDADSGAGGRPEAAGATRRQVLKYGLGGLACLGAGGAGVYCLARRSGSLAAAALSTDVFHNDAPSGRAVGALAATRLGPGGPALSEAGQERPVQALPQRVPAGARRPRPLPQPRQQGRQAVHAGLRQRLYVPRRPHREEAAVPLPARHRRLLVRHVRLRLPLPELPELGHLATQARGDERSARRTAAAEPGEHRVADARRHRPPEPVARRRGGAGRAPALPVDRLHLLRADRVVRVHARHGAAGPRERDQERLGHLRLHPAGTAGRVVPVPGRRQRESEELRARRSTAS